MENIFQTSETGKAQVDGAVTLTTTQSYTIPTNAYRKPGNTPMVNWQLSLNGWGVLCGCGIMQWRGLFRVAGWSFGMCRMEGKVLGLCV
jgi:hypothetical protein